MTANEVRHVRSHVELITIYEACRILGASLDLQRDADVLEALRTRQGSFVRLPGSWRDF